MKILFALGNPGVRYRDTRHNAAWWLADRLCVSWSFPPFDPRDRVASSDGVVDGEAVRILKPLTYVNRSGSVLEELLAGAAFRVEDLMVLVDDVSLEPGRFRLRAQGSAGGHNGLASIEEALGTREYARLRIGVGRPHDSRIDLSEWVLAPMGDADEESVLLAFAEMENALEHWVTEGIESTMSRFNRAAEPAL